MTDDIALIKDSEIIPDDTLAALSEIYVTSAVAADTCKIFVAYLPGEVQ